MALLDGRQVFGNLPTGYSKSLCFAYLSNIFMKDSKFCVVVAIVTFGKGIDLPDVRKVIHIGLHNDIKGYIQETGHGGRDVSMCEAILYRKQSRKIDRNLNELVYQ